MQRSIISLSGRPVLVVEKPRLRVVSAEVKHEAHVEAARADRAAAYFTLFAQPHDAHVQAWAAIKSGYTFDFAGSGETMRISKNQHTEKNTTHVSPTWSRWAALPAVLRAACVEPPKFFVVATPFDAPSRANNPDIPDNQSFDAMALSERSNSHMDSRSMDDRHFREHCVQNDRVNFFLEPKHGAAVHVVKGPDGQFTKVVRARLTRGQTFHDPNWISRKLFCPLDMATKLAKAFVDLEINEWSLARRILYGVVFSGKIPVLFAPKGDRALKWLAVSKKLAGTRSMTAKGLISYSPASPPGAKAAVHGPSDLRGMREAVDFLAMAAEEIAKVTYEPDPMVDLDLSEDAPGVDDDPFWSAADLGPDEQPFIDDDLDVYGGDSNPFTAHPLAGDGSDALPDALVRCMRTATDWNLTNLAKAVRPYWTQESERWVPPNRGMSAAQVSHFWDLWHARRAQVSAAVKVHPMVSRLLMNLESLPENRAKAYIYALKDGRRFMDRQAVIHTEGVRVIPSILKILWQRVNEKFPKRDKAVAF